MADAEEFSIQDPNSDTEEDNEDNNEVKTIIIQTHDKRFHTDDVGAISLLNSYYQQKNTRVHLIRSRDPSLLNTSHILVDVGGVYDPETLRFDHHQKGCEEYFADGFNVKLSSIGMVWKHYGKELLGMYIQSHPDFNQIDIEKYIEGLHTEVYLKSIQEIDGHDNGMTPTSGGKTNYWTYMTIGNIISSYNTSNTNDEDGQRKAFHQATNMFGTIFEKRLEDIIRKYVDYQVGYGFVQEQIEQSTHNTAYLIITDKTISTPTVFKSLNKLDPDGKIKFIVFNPEDEDEITIRTRGKKENIREPMIPILSKEVLVEKLGPDLEDEIIFVHNNQFIGKVTNIETAITVIGESIKAVPVSPMTVPSSYLKIPSIPILKNRGDWLMWGGLGLAGGVVASTILLKNSSDIN